MEPSVAIHNTFLCGPTAQCTLDKKELWAIIKKDNETAQDRKTSF